MTILLHKPYLIKVSMKVELGSKIPKNLTSWFMDDPKISNKQLSRSMGEKLSKELLKSNVAQF